MTYSKTHQRFSERLNQPDVLTNPEKYLGPNYQDILNFWIYLDTLSDEKKEEMKDRFLALDFNVRIAAGNAAGNAADGVIGWKFKVAAWFAAWYAVYDVTKRDVFGWATWEIIGHHKLIEQNKTPTFLPLCVKP
jgi:hypothetical protein